MCTEELKCYISLPLQFATAVPTARMTHTVRNRHWCVTPLPPPETNLARQFQVFARAGIPMPPRYANLALQFPAYAQTCTPVQEQCGTAATRMIHTCQSDSFPNRVNRDLEIQECNMKGLLGFLPASSMQAPPPHESGTFNCACVRVRNYKWAAQGGVDLLSTLVRACSRCPYANTLFNSETV